MKNKLVRLGSAALLGLALAAGAQARGVTDKEIVLGTHLDLSGPVAAGMPHIRNGMQMRIDEVNEAGGINGRKIRLVVEDNAGQPQLAVRVTEKLLRSDDVFAIVNPFGSGANAAAVKKAVDAGALYFAPWAASSVIQKISGNSPLLFTTTPNYDVLMHKGVGWMIKKFDSKKVGFIYQEGPLGDLMAAGVKSAVADNKLTLVAEAAYKVGDIDFSSQVARMKAAGTDLIVAASLTRETIGIMSEVKKLGWTDVKVLTGNPGRTGVVLALGKDTVDGLYGVGPWKVGTDHAAVQAWKEKFKKRFNNMEPDENAVLAYDNTDWLLKGVEAAGKDLTVEKVAKALQTITYDDKGLVLLEPVHFEKNHINPERVEIDQVQKGKWVTISNIIP
ncbi:MAG: ABC transporter substrate-binding protein [Burkholderiaceae bacterium]